MRQSPVASKTRHPAAAFDRDRATWLGYLLVGYYGFLQAVIGPLLPSLRAELGLTYAVAGLHVSAFALGLVLVGIAGHAVTRRVGRRAGIWGGAAGMAPGAVLVAVSPSPIGTIGGALLMGTLGSLSLVATQAGLADRHGVGFPVAMTEANLTASLFAILAAAAVAGAAALGRDPRLALLVPLPYLVVVAAGLGTAPVAGGGVGSLSSPTQGAARRRLPLAFWIFSLVLVLGVAVEWCVAYWGADFLVGAGLRTPDAATAMGAFFAAMAVGRLAGSRLARRIAAPRLLLGALAVALAGLPLFWLAPIMPLTLAGLVVVGFGIANASPLTVAVAAGPGVAPGQADLAMARLAMMGGGAGLLAPLALGALADHWDIRRAVGVTLPLAAAAIATLALATRLVDRAVPAPADGRP